MASSREGTSQQILKLIEMVKSLKSLKVTATATLLALVFLNSQKSPKSSLGPQFMFEDKLASMEEIFKVLMLTVKQTLQCLNKMF